jgi:hypothetical protein
MMATVLAGFWSLMSGVFLMTLMRQACSPDAGALPRLIARQRLGLSRMEPHRYGDLRTRRAI